MGIRKMVILKLMVMLLLMVLGQAAASFEKCYAQCYADCVIDMKRAFPYVPKKLLPCAWKCLKHCIFDPADSTDLYYCKIGCPIDSCSDNFHDATKMLDCVENCSDKFCKNI